MIQQLFMSIPLQSYKNISKKIDEGMKSTYLDSQNSEKSLHSQDRFQPELQSSGKLFSFNQSYTNIQQNDKTIQQKANFMNRIRSLQQELKTCKIRSSLWEKAKSEIVNMNKHLKLSAISLGCSDIAIMKQFFQAINDILLSKEVKIKDEKMKVMENKKKEAELFEKLVESNKKKYQLQQKILQLEHENQKITGINQSLREKSRIQSSSRSSKILQFQQETLMTIQEKDYQLSIMTQRNNELKLDLIHYEQTIEVLRNQLQIKQKDLIQTKDDNEELYLQCQAHKRQYSRLLLQEKFTQQMLTNIKKEMKEVLQENDELKQQIKKKREEIVSLKGIIKDAKLANEAYLIHTQEIKYAEQAKRKEKLALIVQRQQILKNSLMKSTKFAINRRKQKRVSRLLQHSKSQLYISKLETSL